MSHLTTPTIRPPLSAPLLGLASSGCVLMGLIQPLVNIPVIGSEKYVNTTMGGWHLTWIMVVLLLLSTMLWWSRHPKIRSIGGCLSGIVWGLLAGTILSFYRWAADVIMQLGQGEELIHNSTMASGAWWLIVGIGLWIIGFVLLLLRRDV